MQFKNKWSKLKVEYNCWKTLLKETGLGWDQTEQNINMPESWWHKAGKVSFDNETTFFHLCIKL
jgi:hypothetical protein